MAKTISPSGPITEGQIGKVNELLGAKIRKNQKEFPSDVVQQVLISNGDALAKELLAVVRKYVDAASNLITRVVTVNRKRSGKEALTATGRNQYVDDSVVVQMPNGTTEETEVVFFKLGRYVSDNDLDKEYELRGLKPADPFSLAAVNEAAPAFADEHPNGTHWKDKNDKWCYATFFRWIDGRSVCVFRSDDGWNDDWWFAGVRK